MTRYFPLIVEATLKLRQEHFVIDGEAVVLGPDGASLNSGKRNELGAGQIRSAPWHATCTKPGAAAEIAELAAERDATAQRNMMPKIPF